MKVICVAAARPNYMKVKPVMDALDERGADAVLVHRPRPSSLASVVPVAQARPGAK